MKKKKQEQQINYLDLIPVKAEGLKWHKDFRDRVILEVKNEGFFNGIAQKVFNRPEVTKIHLDVHGSYLWPFIDGERTVMDLAAQETCLIHEMSFRVKLKHPIRSQRRSGFV